MFYRDEMKKDRGPKLPRLVCANTSELIHPLSAKQAWIIFFSNQVYHLLFFLS